ncbi:MAG: trehalose-phosphatase [Marmoricola sp.]
MELTTADARHHHDALVSCTGPVVVGLDFDGTLSPIVEDPSAARIHPEAPAALAALGRTVAAIAIVTGRPVAHVLEHGAIEQLADELAGESGGAAVVVLGQYGAERWTSTERRTRSAEPPAALATLRERLPELLARLELGEDPYVEDKGLAFAVHTRRMPDPAGAYDAVLDALTEAAARHDLHVEPGRYVVEVRGADTDKGDAVRTLAAEWSAQGFVFVGDDLGDVPAFEAVAGLRDAGTAGLLVASGSTEQSALTDRADVVVDGPEGVVALLRDLAEARARPASGPGGSTVTT